MNEDKDCFSTNYDDNQSSSPFSVRRFLSFQFHETENSVSRESQDDTISLEYHTTDNFLSRERQQDLIEEFNNDGSPPNKRFVKRFLDASLIWPTIKMFFELFLKGSIIFYLRLIINEWNFMG